MSQLVKCNYTSEGTNDETNYNNSLTTLSIKILNRPLPILIVSIQIMTYDVLTMQKQNKK